MRVAQKEIVSLPKVSMSALFDARDCSAPGRVCHDSSRRRRKRKLFGLTCDEKLDPSRGRRCVRLPPLVSINQSIIFSYTIMVCISYGTPPLCQKKTKVGHFGDMGINLLGLT